MGRLCLKSCSNFTVNSWDRPNIGEQKKDSLLAGHRRGSFPGPSNPSLTFCLEPPIIGDVRAEFPFLSWSHSRVSGYLRGTRSRMVCLFSCCSCLALQVGSWVACKSVPAPCFPVCITQARVQTGALSYLRLMEGATASLCSLS